MKVHADLSALMQQLASIKQEKLTLLKPQLESLLIAHSKGEASLSSPELEMLTRAVECISLTGMGINKNLFNMPALDNDRIAKMSPEQRSIYVAKIAKDFDDAANQLVEHVSLMHQLISFNNTPDSLAAYA